MSSTTSALPRIAIIGGGPAGLVFLLTLYRRGIPANLYERDTGFSSCAHMGGTLDLGWHTGQRALRENGLESAFKEHSRPQGEEFKLCDAAGNILIQHCTAAPTDPVKARPEIDRSVLRKILLDAVPAGAVKWDHALSAIRPLEGGQHEITFTNGVQAVSDLVVGADGAHSRVRPLVSPAEALYTGVTGAEISLVPEVVARDDMQQTHEMVGHGSTSAVENARMLGSQRNGDGRIRTYAWFRGPLNWSLPKDPSAARKVLLDIYEGWAPWMRQLIELCDDAAIYHRPLFCLPVGHCWAHVPGVILVGDAAHLMSPFAGEGANLAMLDGLELGLAVADAVSGGKNREGAIRMWEEKMFAMSAKTAAITKTNLEAFVSPDAPASAVERTKAFMAERA